MLAELAFVVLERQGLPSVPLSLDVIARGHDRSLFVGLEGRLLEYALTTGVGGARLELRHSFRAFDDPYDSTRAQSQCRGRVGGIVWIASLEWEEGPSASATVCGIALSDGLLQARHRIELAPRSSADQAPVAMGIDDVTGDGVCDYVLSDCAADSRRGRLLVISAASGVVAGSVAAPSEGNVADFGQFVRTAGDWNGDGVAEILVSAPETGALAPGVALVDPVQRSNLRVFRPLGERQGLLDGYLTTAECIPDVDGDGGRDVVVGWSRHSWAGPRTRGGEVQVLSGASGRCVARLAGLELCEYLGEHIQLVESKPGVTTLAVSSARDVLLVEVR